RHSDATLSRLTQIDAVTQGSSLLATQSWRTQSLWDWKALTRYTGGEGGETTDSFGKSLNSMGVPRRAALVFDSILFNFSEKQTLRAGFNRVAENEYHLGTSWPKSGVRW